MHWTEDSHGVVATAKVAGTIQKSTQIMTLVNRLTRVSEISAVMQSMSKEMMKVQVHFKGWFSMGCDV